MVKPELLNLVNGCYSVTRSLLVVVIYRQPTSCAPQPFGNFLDEFGDYLSLVLSKHKNVLLVGDFNVKFNKPEDSDTCSLIDMFYNFNLKQYVQCSTHTSGNTLDLIVARDNSNLDISNPTESWYISDHCFIECNLKFSKPQSEKSISVIEKLKTLTVTKFANDLQKVAQDLENISDLSELAEQYNVRISQCLDKHAPVKTKTITIREQLFWYNNELSDIKRKKRKAIKMWLKSKNTQNWTIYKSLSQSLHNAISVSK